MNRNKKKLFILKNPPYRFQSSLFIGVTILIIIFGSGCGFLWPASETMGPESGGTGLSLGRASLKLNGSAAMRSAGYRDWHISGESNGFKLDSAIVSLGAEDLKGTVLTTEELAEGSINYEDLIKGKLRYKGDSEVDLTIWSWFGDLQYELSKPSFFPSSIRKTIRPYVGLGLGYLFNVDYEVATSLAGQAFLDASEFSGRGMARRLVAGIYLFPDSDYSIRIGYQSFSSNIRLRPLKRTLEIPLSLEGKALIGEIIYNMR